ncbi:hypothetical protein [Simkania sp.]|uniref:hypothetical protein n=1 Tax=Simkania sp. TaxID=34094 RepID=UPI003B52398F
MKKLFYLLPAFFIFNLLPLQGVCPIQEGGYQGDLGTVEGNCETFDLPPLSAFGSLSINQNAPLGAINRINSDQLPVTNNFQLFQQECAILQTITWTQGEISKGGNGLNMRAGPFLVGMARTGPSVLIPQYSIFLNPTFPNLVTDTRTTIFFSTAEVNQGGANDYFDIGTDIQNTQTCVLTYTPKNGTAGQLVDYNVLGNVFHDVYYDNLTPWIASSNAL